MDHGSEEIWTAAWLTAGPSIEGQEETTTTGNTTTTCHAVGWVPYRGSVGCPSTMTETIQRWLAIMSYHLCRAFLSLESPVIALRQSGGWTDVCKYVPTYCVVRYRAAPAQRKLESYDYGNKWLRISRECPSAAAV